MPLVTGLNAQLIWWRRHEEELQLSAVAAMAGAFGHPVPATRFVRLGTSAENELV